MLIMKNNELRSVRSVSGETPITELTRCKSAIMTEVFSDVDVVDDDSHEIIWHSDIIIQFRLFQSVLTLTRGSLWVLSISP